MNPWVIIGFIVALAGAWFAGDRHGHNTEKQTWTVSAQKTQLDYNQKLKVAQDAKEVTERAFSDLKDQTDAQHDSDKAAIKDASDRADAAIAGGLRRATSCNAGAKQPVPDHSQPEPGNGGGTASQFYLLPEQAPERLRDRYAEADNYLSLYRACRTRLKDAIDKSQP